jgi:hypothetical protein
MSDSDYENKKTDPYFPGDADDDRSDESDHDIARPIRPTRDDDNNQNNEGAESLPRNPTGEGRSSSRTHPEDHRNSSRTPHRRHHSSKKNKEPSSSKSSSYSKPSSSSKTFSSSKSSSSSKWAPSSKSTSSSKTSRSRLENHAYAYVDSGTPNYTTDGVEQTHYNQYNSSDYNQQPTFDPADNSGISWGSWSRLPNGQWHREGSDSLGIIKLTLFFFSFFVMQVCSLIMEVGNWYEDNRNEDPRDRRVPRQLPIVPEGIPNAPSDAYSNVYNSSGISWGPWTRLQNGQWHREGQDALGIMRHTILIIYKH